MNTPPLATIGLLPSAAGLLQGATQVADLAAAAEAGLDFVLGHQDGALSLWRVASRDKPLSVDFVSGRLGYRLASGRARQETLVRAVLGRHAPADTRVLDATAGLGRDAALLAAAGCEVLMLERQPLLALLLEDGLRRAAACDFSQRLTLERQDALGKMSGAVAPLADVIYLDPMFTDTGSKASVKKELAWLKQLLGPASEAEEGELLVLARQQAKRRVVVKRAAKAPALAGEVPTASVGGKAVRFDIYTPC